MLSEISWGAIAILSFVTVQRLSELVIAQRNTARLVAKGGYEVAGEHYPMIVAVHSSWLLGLWWLAWNALVHWGWLAVYVVLQVLRFWVLGTIGKRWTTRIIVVPGEQLVRRGPYKFLNHPNYAVVIGEIAVLPLVFGLTWFGVVFSVLNAVVLSIRISAEQKALTQEQAAMG